MTTPTPVELTAKKWKATQLVGIALLLVGVAARIGTGDYWWSALALFGVFVYALGRILAWWNHG